MRTLCSKHNGETKYYLEGAKAIYEKTGNDTIYYSYDAGGSLIGLNYNGTLYWYVRNGQGDIIGTLSDSLAQVVWYTYSTWGELVSVKDASGAEITSPTHIGLT